MEIATYLRSTGSAIIWCYRDRDLCNEQHYTR